MNNDRVNDRVQKKLIDVMKNNRNGLWCCELPEKYYGLHKSEFDFRYFGYTSLIEMVLELPEIFRCYQPSLGDWILYDASFPKSKEEEELERFIEKTRKDHIPNSLKLEIKKLLDLFQEEIGKNMDEIPSLYYKKFKKKLDFEILGFTDLLSFFKSLEGDMVHLRKVEKSVYILPLKSKGNVSTFQDLNNLGEAIPPILPGDDLFLEFFPENAFRPNETIPKLQIEKYLEIGSVMAMQVADVWTPHKFYVQLTEFEKERNELIHDLENFYNEKSHKYKMPEVTVQPNQICAVNFRYKNTVEKWHRAEVIKILKTGKVSVRLIDYGIVVPVKYKALRFLPRKFGDLPRSAIPAALANLEPVSSSKTWSDHTNKRFLELVTSSWLIMEVVDLDDKEFRLILRLYDAMNETLVSINEILIKEGNACFSEELFKFYKQEIKVDPKKKGIETKETGIKDTISNENYNLPSESNSSFMEPVKAVQAKESRKEKTTSNEDNSDQCKINSSLSQPVEAIQAKESRKEKTTSNEDNSDQCKINSSFSQPVEAIQAKESRKEKTTSNKDHSDECKIKTRPQPVEATEAKEARMQETTSTDSHNLPSNQFGMQTFFLPTENVEAWKTLIHQQQLIQQMQKQAFEEKLQINNLALHFFSTHPDIKNVSQLNPELGLRLATNLAKSYLENIKPVINL